MERRDALVLTMMKNVRKINNSGLRAIYIYIFYIYIVEMIINNQYFNILIIICLTNSYEL